jgi:O-antigen/teichoic acid export membrane protein
VKLSSVFLRGGGEIAGILLGVIATVWLSRVIGPTYFGYYAVMLVIVALGGLLINAGLPNVGAQRIANDQTEAGEVVWMVTVARIALAVIVIAAGLLVLSITPMDPILRDYLGVGIAIWAIAPLRSEWALVALGMPGPIAFIRVAGPLASLLVALVFVRDVSDAGRVAWVPVAGAVISAIGSSLVASRASSLRRVSGSTLAAIRAYLRDGFQYFKSDLAVFTYTSADRIFLYVFSTPAIVGLYEAAYRVINPFYAISAVVHDAMYLQIAQAYGTIRLKSVFRRYVDLMSFATIPLGCFLLAFASTVISIVYGAQYAAASAYLAILGWVITFGYTSGIVVIPFTAWNRPREYANTTTLGAAVNLVFNAALIPPYGGIGASLATVAAKLAVTVVGLGHFRRATDYPVVRDFAEYLAISGAALVVGYGTGIATGLPLVGMLVFATLYLVLVAIVRWQRPHAPDLPQSSS